jgi:hypothetical protein
MFCCRTLEGWVQDAGHRGVAFIAQHEENYRGFFIQARACDFPEHEKLSSIPTGVDLPPISIRSELGIQFCPFCGSPLEKVISDNIREFDQLAEQHAKYVA